MFLEIEWGHSETHINFDMIFLLFFSSCPNTDRHICTHSEYQAASEDNKMVMLSRRCH